MVGGTSSSCPQWAALVAIADQIAGHGLGLINPKLYSLASGPNYGSYFYDVTTGNNQADPSVPGYPATTGWDPVTGLGTPNAATWCPRWPRGSPRNPRIAVSLRPGSRHSGSPGRTMPGRERRRSRPGPNPITERAAIKCALKPLTDEPQGPGSTQPGRSLPPATAAPATRQSVVPVALLTG